MARPRKYGNNPTEVDGFRFSSKKEAGRYADLKLMQRAGVISQLKIQPRFDIAINGVKACFYLADFSYVRDGQEVVEDVKSPITRKQPVYRLKNKLMRAVHGVNIVEI